MALRRLGARAALDARGLLPGAGARGPGLTVAWASGPNDIWAAGPRSGDTVAHYDGRAWRKVETMLYGVNALHGASGRVVMVGNSGYIHSVSDGKWATNQVDARTTFTGAFVAPGGAAWATADDGKIRFSPSHGAPWTTVFTSSDEPAAVWGASATDVWAVDGSTFLRWNGSTWSTFATALPTDVFFHALWGTAANDVWALGSWGQTGVTAHFDGSTWTLHEVGVSRVLSAMHGTGAGDLWAVGAKGAVLRRKLP